jgi:PPOX class probable F420-dependent enzyme
MRTDELWEILTQSRNGVLATMGPDGTPQLSNVYYLVDRGAAVVRFSTISDRVKGRNLMRHPKASLHVSGRNFLNYAVVAGRVSVAVPSGPDDDAIERLFEIYEDLGANPERAGFAEKMLADHRVVVELAVQRIYGQIIDREPRTVGPTNGGGAA